MHSPMWLKCTCVDIIIFVICSSCALFLRTGFSFIVTPFALLALITSALLQSSCAKYLHNRHGNCILSRVLALDESLNIPRERTEQARCLTVYWWQWRHSNYGSSPPNDLQQLFFSLERSNYERSLELNCVKCVVDEDALNKRQCVA